METPPTWGYSSRVYRSTSVWAVPLLLVEWRWSTSDLHVMITFLKSYVTLGYLALSRWRWWSPCCQCGCVQRIRTQKAAQGGVWGSGALSAAAPSRLKPSCPAPPASAETHTCKKIHDVHWIYYFWMQYYWNKVKNHCGKFLFSLFYLKKTKSFHSGVIIPHLNEKTNISSIWHTMYEKVKHVSRTIKVSKTFWIKFLPLVITILFLYLSLMLAMMHLWQNLDSFHIIEMLLLMLSHVNVTACETHFFVFCHLVPISNLCQRYKKRVFSNKKIPTCNKEVARVVRGL